jgi:glutaredoxin
MSIWQRLRGETPAPGPSVRLMTRQGCCLCDEARRILQAHGLAVEEVDIDIDPQLRERYTNCVPVVIIDGKERFRGRVDPLLLRRLLEGGRRDSPSAEPDGSNTVPASDTTGASDTTEAKGTEEDTP